MEHILSPVAVCVAAFDMDFEGGGYSREKACMHAGRELATLGRLPLKIYRGNRFLYQNAVYTPSHVVVAGGISCIYISGICFV